MNGIVYIILEEYNTYYEVGEQDNSDLHNNSLPEYRNRRRYLERKKLISTNEETHMNGKIYKPARNGDKPGLCDIMLLR